MGRSIILALSLAVSMTVTPGRAPASSAAGGTVLELHSVSCVTSRFCVAIGTGSGPAHQSVAVQWDGSTWTARSMATPPSVGSEYLGSISCVTSTFCMVVGHDFTLPNQTDPIAETWNGTTWTWLTMPELSGASSATLESVWCTSTTNCVAVGDWPSPGANVPLTERWDGMRWALLPTPPLPHGGFDGRFAGVSCAAATVCIAVGGAWLPSSRPCPSDAQVTACERALADRWNGTRWTLLSMPSTGKLKHAYLTHISCISATSCVAVGYATLYRLDSRHKMSTSYRPLAVRWHGKRWTVETIVTPAPSQHQWTTLSGVTCSGARDCIAVGSQGYLASGPGWALAERWNGTNWTSMSVTSPRQYVTLNSVSCTASNRCMAVGYSSREQQEALVERWDGTRWTIQSSP